MSKIMFIIWQASRDTGKMMITEVLGEKNLIQRLITADYRVQGPGEKRLIKDEPGNRLIEFCLTIGFHSLQKTFLSLSLCGD